MKFFIVLTIAFAFLITACSSKYKYWDISKFNIDNHVLQPLEEIKLLYSSRAPEYDNDRKYYIHIVVESQKTGDTINILTTANNVFVQQDGGKIFNFLPDENTTDHFQKVARDPEYDHIADNNFPTVIGGIGELVQKPDNL